MYGNPERYAGRKTRWAAIIILKLAALFGLWAFYAQGLERLVASGFAALLLAAALLAWTLRSALSTENRDLAASLTAGRHPDSQVER